jgi:hypothetical protein
LRDALDWLRDTIAPRFEERAREIFKDPWGARDEYINVVLDRSPENVDGFFREQSTHELSEDEKIVGLRLMEMQRHAMLMYTSCGWFFDELSGIETTQVIQYAARTLQLYQDIFNDSLESMFLDRLERAKSNISEHRDGRTIYERFVRPAMIDRRKVAAHYGLISLFERPAKETKVYCYRLQLEDFQSKETGHARIVVGRARVMSEITRQSDVYSFGALHMGDHLMNCGVGLYESEEAYDNLHQELDDPFVRADFTEVIRILDRYFGESTYSLRSIFHDDQRKILSMVMNSTLAEAEAVYRKLYETHAPMMRFVIDLGVPLPRAFSMAAEFALNSSLRTAFEDLENLDLARINSLLHEAKTDDIPLDAPPLEFALRRAIEWFSRQLVANPDDIELMKTLEALASMARVLPFEVNVWTVQNNYYQILQNTLPDSIRKASNGDASARQWLEHFVNLGKSLSLKLDEPVIAEFKAAS